MYGRVPLLPADRGSSGHLAWRPNGDERRKKKKGRRLKTWLPCNRGVYIPVGQHGRYVHTYYTVALHTCSSLRSGRREQTRLTENHEDIKTAKGLGNSAVETRVNGHSELRSTTKNTSDKTGPIRTGGGLEGWFVHDLPGRLSQTALIPSFAERHSRLGKGADGFAILIRVAMFRPVDRQKQPSKSGF